MEGWLVPTVFFLFLAAVIITPQVLRSRDRARMYEVMRAAYEKGQPIPPELVDAMTRRNGEEAVLAAMQPQPGMSGSTLRNPASPVDRDLRRGVIMLAVGVGLVGVGAAFYAGLYSDGGASETFGAFAAMGAIPGCIGLAYLGLWYFGRRKAAG